MAAIRCKQDVLVVLSGKNLYVYSDGKEKELQLPETAKDEKKDEDDKLRKTVPTTDNPNCILAAAFSKSAKYFAVGDNDKQLHLYDVKSNWQHLYSRLKEGEISKVRTNMGNSIDRTANSTDPNKRAPTGALSSGSLLFINATNIVLNKTLARRCTALAFSNNEADLVVADRTGDVYKYSVTTETESEGQLLLGHLSMVLDVVLTSDDKYVITCDRDEKIRISHYPNAYSIHTFCLLHTEYVSQVLLVDNLNCLVSGSGDGRVAVWDLSGSCQHVIQEGDDQSMQNGDQFKAETDQEGDQSQEEQFAVKRIIYDETISVLAVIYQKSCKVHLYLLQSESDKVKVTDRQEVELQGECWDICFDSQHRLWALQSCQERPVAVYSCQRDGNQFKVTKSEQEEMVKSVVQKIDANWDSLKSAVDWRTEFISLTKIKSFDNVQKYLERKEERIKGMKSVPEEPPEKKVKNSG